MDDRALVSPEVVARVHSEQLRVLMLLSDLQRHARSRHDERLLELVDALVAGLRCHMGLVDGVLDALTPDEVALRIGAEGAGPHKLAKGA